MTVVMVIASKFSDIHGQTIKLGQLSIYVIALL